jgi:hypothetical protein
MTPSDRWLTALEARHFSDLTFQEVSRSLRALSATYVERRDRLREGAALTGAFGRFPGPSASGRQLSSIWGVAPALPAQHGPRRATRARRWSVSIAIRGR